MRTADSIEETKAAKSLKGASSELGRDGKRKGKRGKHPNSLKALKVAPWPKGVSGNPGGLPGYDVSAQLARAVIEENREAIYIGLAKAAITGNAYVFKEVSERGYGKLKETLDVTNYRAKVKDEDLDKRIKE